MKEGAELFLVIFSLVVFCLAGEAALKTRPFSYHEDFEEKDPLKFYAGKGKYRVNYQGLTEEIAWSGKKSYKLDITFDEPGSYTLEIPLNDLPVSEKLKFTGMIYVKECLLRSRAVLGFDFRYLPIIGETTGVRSFPWSAKCDRWVKIQADLADRVHARATQLLSFQVWGAKPENVAVCLPRLFLHVFTRDPGPKDPVPAHRPFVVYLDDLKIEGEVPEPKEEFEKEAVRRWAPVAEKTKKKIGEWEEIIAQAEKDLASLPVVSGEAAVLKAALEKEMKARDVRRLPEIQEAKKTGMLSQATYDKLAPFYTRLRNGQYLANIKTLSQPERVSQIKSTGMLIYTVNPTSNPAEWVLPGTVLVPGEISNNLKITACPGEYEPGSFVVRAISDMKGLEIQPGELVGSGGKIPSSAVDIKVVKCWYQDEDGRRLVPELLLNDDSLVKVDEEAKISRIKFKVGEETKYLCYDDAEWADFTKGKIKVANDAGRLLPVDIPAGTSKQFWVTVRVPEEARAGTYQGKLCLISGGKSLAEMNLSLQVLPFKLSLPYYQVSIWGGTDRNEARYINIVKNQLAHGVTVPFHSLSGGSDRLVQLEKTLKIWRDLGVTTDVWMAPGELVYSLLAGGKSHKGLTRIEVTEEQKKRYQEEFQKYAELGKKYGMKEIYFYLADERDAAELEAWLPVFEIVRAAGGKVMNGTNIGKTFEITGGKIDIFGCSTGVSRREADKWHSVGTKIWSVWNPRGGVEDFELNRRRHGLYLWQATYDGVTEYLYSLDQGWAEAVSTKAGVASDGIWNMVYLTADGAIDTVEWEGYREGVDDVRYVTTLTNLIKEVKQTGKKKQEVAAAERFLEGIDVEDGDLDSIRRGVIEHILRLR